MFMSHELCILQITGLFGDEELRSVLARAFVSGL